MTPATDAGLFNKPPFTNLGKSNIFLIGFMGSGKTHWGKIWADVNKLNFVDLDAMIEADTGKSISLIFDSLGEAEFRKIESDTLKSCANLQNTIISTGGGAPCFFDNMYWMNENGITIFITCEAEEIEKRVLLEKDKRPLFRKLKPAELLSFIQQKLKERLPFYSRAIHTISSEIASAESLTEIITTKNI